MSLLVSVLMMVRTAERAERTGEQVCNMVQTGSALMMKSVLTFATGVRYMRELRMKETTACPQHVGHLHTREPAAEGKMAVEADASSSLTSDFTNFHSRHVTHRACGRGDKT